MDWRVVLEDQNPWWRDAQKLPQVPPRRRAAFGPVLKHAQDLGDRRAALLLGRRQVGKTTLLHQVIAELLATDLPPTRITFFDYLDPRVDLTSPPSPAELLEASPRLTVQGEQRILILDELQRLPEWDRWLKTLVDAKSAKVLATGSSVGELKRGARESGLGRWDEFQIEGLSLAEFVQLVRGVPDAKLELERSPELLDRYLEIGGFPEHVTAQPGPSVRRRIRDDLVDRAIFRDLAQSRLDVTQVARLFRYFIERSGAELAVAPVASDLGVKAETVRNYLQHLSDARLVSVLERLPVGDKGGKVRRSDRIRAQDKIYAADHGMISAFAPLPSRGLSESERAAIFEAVVFRHLREYERDHPGTALHYFARTIAPRWISSWTYPAGASVSRSRAAGARSAACRGLGGPRRGSPVASACWS